VCKLPTNGHEVGDEVFLTDAEVANANGGESEPRYVLAEDQSEKVVVDQQMLDENPVLAESRVDVGAVGTPAPGETTNNTPGTPTVGYAVTQPADRQ
jgi:hypothetical protein